MKLRLPVTILLIGMSLGLTLLTRFGSDIRLLSTLMISNTSQNLNPVFAGEVWRLVTPTFIHFNIYHLVFNLLWIWVMGGAIERLKGSKLLLLIFLISGSLSNLAEFYFSGPLFGGMSGVVYAFFGYIWMQSKYNPLVFGRVLPPAIVPLMMIWFGVCWFGLVGSIANYAHTAGLVIGIVWGRAHTSRTARHT